MQFHVEMLQHVEESGLCKTLWAEIVRNKCVKVRPGCPVLIKLKNLVIHSLYLFIFCGGVKRTGMYIVEKTELYCHLMIYR